jgi:hypothetical protein
MFAPPICRRRWRNNAFPFRQLRRRRRQPSEHRSEQSERSNAARLREQLKTSCERRKIARRRTEEERAEAFFPLRATTTPADIQRDCASS